jgi:hypothetical protein
MALAISLYRQPLTLMPNPNNQSASASMLQRVAFADVPPQFESPKMAFEHDKKVAPANLDQNNCCPQFWAR